jgi:precorrin-6Y C5,15-methyltransferase (decarboxylating)
LFGADKVRVLPHVSAVTLACARIGWNVHETEVISLVTAKPSSALRRGGQAIVLSSGRATPQELAVLLNAHGRGDSELTVLEQLGGPNERRRDGTARQWADAGMAPDGIDDLNVVAVRYLPDERVSSLPDDAFVHDGQITKHGVRAVTLAALAPRPGERLWDVGAGSGSIAVEWCRSGPGCTAVAFERDERRRANVIFNASAFGVTIDARGEAPDGFDGALPPSAIFIGGGMTQPGLLDACLGKLAAAGRLVVNAVTVESEAAVAAAFSKHGGELRRFQHYHAEPLGGFAGWRPQLPVTQWTVTT